MNFINFSSFALSFLFFLKKILFFSCLYGIMRIIMFRKHHTRDLLSDTHHRILQFFIHHSRKRNLYDVFSFKRNIFFLSHILKNNKIKNFLFAFPLTNMFLESSLNSQENYMMSMISRERRSAFI